MEVLQQILKEHQNAQELAKVGYINLYSDIGKIIFDFGDKVIDMSELDKDGNLIIELDKVLEYKRDLLFNIKKSLEKYETECLKWRVPDNEE